MNLNVSPHYLHMSTQYLQSANEHSRPCNNSGLLSFASFRRNTAWIAWEPVREVSTSWTRRDAGRMEPSHHPT